MSCWFGFNATVLFELLSLCSAPKPDSVFVLVHAPRDWRFVVIAFAAASAGAARVLVVGRSWYVHLRLPQTQKTGNKIQEPTYMHKPQKNKQKHKCKPSTQ